MKVENTDYYMCEGIGLTNISGPNNRTFKASVTSAPAMSHGPGFPYHYIQKRSQKKTEFQY